MKIETTGIFLVTITDGPGPEQEVVDIVNFLSDFDRVNPSTGGPETPGLVRQGGKWTGCFLQERLAWGDHGP
jgi:hypothetical protein